MKHYILLLFVIFICSMSGTAQLTKFNGTWVNKEIQMSIDKNGKHPYAERTSIYRFDTYDSTIQIRKKTHYRFLKTNEESTCYYTIKNIVVNDDGSITCDIYNPPEMGKSYTNKTTPHNNKYYSNLVEHSRYRFSLTGIVLNVEKGPIIREFFLDGQLIDTDSDREDYIYRFECYNEKDNW